ncbi:hypothetical protein C7445_11074 [Alicyclobacillus sacchari]|uniref:Uncharacterized protein n=1 Tax=Alicyclobacillus sacchari TaxID=392010 RepID=A0A4R8LM42_9BACL|nr:hypothetical protein [Alicyclobacillus sacchari]TDY44029.1 hypothetical protein C7445_11074 [Alicyclobacillus sacchari]GMA58288.1 hypothetical protein GCM10025858_27910 [Alicyclobacillus sacchari]
MERFEEQLTRIRDRFEAANAASHVVTSQTETKESLVALFNDIARTLHETDPNLEAKVITTKSVELAVAFLNSHFYSPRCKVTAKYNDGNVDVRATDEFWQQAPNENGLWGDWIDEQIIYQGSYSDELIRDAIEKTVLTWYERLKENGDPGLTPQ